MRKKITQLSWSLKMIRTTDLFETGKACTSAMVILHSCAQPLILYFIGFIRNKIHFRYGYFTHCGVIVWVTVKQTWNVWRNMMTSWNGNIFCVTVPLWGESTGQWWIPLTKASDAELWFFFCAWKITSDQSIEMPVISNAAVLIVTSL